MAGYLLNLTFDLQSSATATGLFNDSTSVPPDATSKVWYPVPASWPPVLPSPGGQVNAPIFSFPAGSGQSDTGVLSCQVGDLLFIRLFARNWSGANGLSFCAAFGRNAPTLATLASPFTISGNGRPQTMYLPANSGPLQGSWIFYLGQLAQIGDPGFGLGFYSFIVTAEVSDSSNNVVQYGHDPIIVVGGEGV
jgi:hypothetical protein